MTFNEIVGHRGVITRISQAVARGPSESRRKCRVENVVSPLARSHRDRHLYAVSQ